MVPVFPAHLSRSVVLGQFPHKHFLYCSGSACSDFTEILGKFLVFYFPFFHFLTIVNPWSVAPLLVFWPISGGFTINQMSMIFSNHSSQMILVNDAKHIHFYPAFQLPFAPSHWPSYCKYELLIKSIEFCKFCHKCGLNSLSAI